MQWAAVTAQRSFSRDAPQWRAPLTISKPIHGQWPSCASLPPTMRPNTGCVPHIPVSKISGWAFEKKKEIIIDMWMQHGRNWHLDKLCFLLILVSYSTRNQFDMYSFVSQSWCAFWQKNDVLLKWSILKSTSESKPQRKAYHLKDTALLCDF